MTKRIAKKGEFTGWHMLMVLGLFFGTIISVNLTMAYFAKKSWTGLVVKNTYVASQEFNETTERRRAEIALGWKAVTAYENGQLVIELRDKDGAPIRDAIVTANVGRPAFEQEDHIVQFAETGAGTYTVDDALKGGIWQAKLDVVDANGTHWTQITRIMVK